MNKLFTAFIAGLAIVSCGNGGNNGSASANANTTSSETVSETSLSSGSSSTGDVQTDLNRYFSYAYVGEWDTRNPDKQSLYIIRNGKIDFEYHLPMRDETNRVQEFDDICILPDGNILYAAMSQLGIINTKGELVWQYICPQGTESHSCQPLDNDRVYFALNGVPGKIVIWNTKTNEMEKEIIVPTEGTNSHGQFRHVRRTAEGTYTTGLFHESKAVEIDEQGNILFSFDAGHPWHVEKLDNGNYLAACDSERKVVEVNKDGETVWEFAEADAPFQIYNTQTATRLANGNTLITSWVAGRPEEEWAGSVQFFEVTPDKDVVWQVSSWENPDLGPCTYVRIIEEKYPAEKMTNGTPNNAMGKAKGIVPGRVAWVHAPGVATWDGQTGIWAEARWNDQAKADEMIRLGVCSVADVRNAKRAWLKIFTDFNKTHGRQETGYTPGEKIAIKLNMNNTFAYEDNDQLNSSPYVTLALLRSLIHDGGVREEDITVCEPSRYITDLLYNLCHGEFPGVTFVDNVGEQGRVKCEFYDIAIPFTEGYGEKQHGLAKCIVDADYVINSALLKIHAGPGVTLTAKNWYGACNLDKDWHHNSHNGINQDKRNGTVKYSSQVDFIGHKDLGGKCLLYLIDGTYGSRDVNGAPDPKWQSHPFNGDWACSILMSQDPLAVDSVGLDMLASEWPEVGSLSYCDLYLVEAASIPNAPSGVKYDPENDGEPLSEPLGIHEHWNAKHNYTAIDLRYIKL